MDVGVWLPRSVSPRTARTIDAAAATPRLRAHPNPTRSSSETHGSNAAWARPPTPTTEVERVTETPKLLSYSSFKDRLSIDIRPVRPLGTEAPVTDCHACHTFRSCRFSRLQRFPPHRPAWACCIPLPTMRFTWFRADRRLLPTTPLSPQMHTLRSLSLLTKWKPVTLSKIGPKTAPGEVHRSPCPSRWFATRALVPPPKRRPVESGAPPSGV